MAFDWNKHKGEIYKVPIDDQYYTYGRYLSPIGWEFFDCRTDVDIPDLELIISKPVLFLQGMHKSALREWKRVGKSMTDIDKFGDQFVFFHQNRYDPNDCHVLSLSGLSKTVSPRECQGLYPATSAEAWHVEQRLRNHYAGKEDPTQKLFDLKIP